MKVPHFIAAIALAALVVLLPAPSRAQALDKPDPSVRAWLPGCRAFLEHHEFMAGPKAQASAPARSTRCFTSARLLEPDYRFCVPLRTPRQEFISAIVEDIEALRPEVDRQDFKGMVLAILRFRWPCRE